jgi:hypothetical protein
MKTVALTNPIEARKRLREPRLSSGKWTHVTPVFDE